MFVAMVAAVLWAAGVRVARRLGPPAAASPAQTAVIEGIWQRYSGPGSGYDYMIQVDGRYVPFTLENGDTYLERRVRVVVDYIDGGPAFRVVSIEAVD